MRLILFFLTLKNGVLMICRSDISAIKPKFKTGGKVTINHHSTSLYREHIGLVDKEPIKDAFRFWYTVRFEMKGYLTIVRFAEEELSKSDI